MTDKVEELIQEKGLTAPRITPDQIDALIVDESYTILPSGRVMVCELILKNGFSVRGESSCVSKENFDKDVGILISRRNAVNQIWQLEAYLLQQKLHEEKELNDLATGLGSLDADCESCKI